MAAMAVAMIEIVHADCLTLTAEDFAEFHALFVDPPYSEHVHANAASMGTQGAGSMGAHKRDLTFASLSPELLRHIALATAHVRRWSCVFSDHESTHLWRAASTAEYIRMVPWVRWSQPQLSGDRPPTGSEAVSIFHARAPGRKHWNGPGSLTHFSRRCLRGLNKQPTEKPLDLMMDIVSWFSDPGEYVLDMCAGAGTTALACQLLGRHCLAVELDPNWAACANERLRGALSDRDRARATEWCQTSLDEALRVPAPKAANGSDVKTYERALRRISDIERVAAQLGSTNAQKIA
jgi:hypothetical protein